MSHVRRGDTVAVISGKERGKRGKVMRILDKKDRVVIEKIMMVKRHTKPSQKNPQGGIIEKEGSVHLSNVALWCPKCTAGRRSKVQSNAQGKHVRHCNKCGHEFVPVGM